MLRINKAECVKEFIGLCVMATLVMTVVKMFMDRF